MMLLLVVTPAALCHTSELLQTATFEVQNSVIDDVPHSIMIRAD